MYLKRYRTRSVKEALGLIREDLGPSALVLSTRLVARDGWRGCVGFQEVEVTAAADRPMSESRSEAQPFRHSRAADPGHAALMARLCATGLDRRVADEIASSLPPDNRRGGSLASLRQTLAERLAQLAAADEGSAPIEVFVGPPGVGKTTTIAKIAAQQRALRGERVRLIAADGYRVGAVEQLRLYADIVGAPFTAARTPGELERAMTAGGSPLLVDTAGRSPGDPASREMWELLASHRGIRTHLVVSAATGSRELESIFDGFGAARPSRVVLTKLDEAESLSPLVGVLRSRRLPISYLGTGQRVPEDLQRATGPLLAACVLGDRIAREDAQR